MIEYQQIVLANGEPGFRKFRRRGHSDCFRAEAEGLQAIAATATVPTPQVLRFDETELITGFIASGSESEPGWSTFGRQLARMHELPQATFGFSGDNFCGATLQLNPPCEDGHEFFAEYRLNFQARLARDSGLLDSLAMRRLEAILVRLPELIPAQEPALLHGDLWRGNVRFNIAGTAHLIDPACYWGWPEAELGMTTLFGVFSPTFYQAYTETRPLQQGWRERLPLYNLYHLLNHLNLFGVSYHEQVLSVLARYR